jgi:hypothetical protein
MDWNRQQRIGRVLSNLNRERLDGAGIGDLAQERGFDVEEGYKAPALRDPRIGRSVGDFQEGSQGVFALAVGGRGNVDGRRQDDSNGIEQQLVGLAGGGTNPFKVTFNALILKDK